GAEPDDADLSDLHGNDPKRDRPAATASSAAAAGGRRIRRSVAPLLRGDADEACAGRAERGRRARLRPLCVERSGRPPHEHTISKGDEMARITWAEWRPLGPITDEPPIEP